MEAHIINIALGHPGDALGSMDGQFPLAPPKHWQMGCQPDEKQFSGTSLHEPATAENIHALRTLRRAGFKRFFLDDDFRLARFPGIIGGCFCYWHRTKFLQRHGYSSQEWVDLLDQVKARRYSRLVREWVDFTAAELSASFHAQHNAISGGELGIMAMYLGAEKAGIRLADYSHNLFRVGEGMFDDTSFGALKGKTDELFSILTHRRFCRPELAFSETTAYPANGLGARNLAAKLVLSTITDTRNTMFMSGLTPFPRTHWDVLAPAMKTQASFHRFLGGHQLRGPLKHYWGEAGRYVSNDQPFSLFLASGIPFEVTDTPARDGWTFLGDDDARLAVSGKLLSRGTRFIHRPAGALQMADANPMEETFEAMMSFKASVIPHLKNVPYVEENEPAICAWYPTAKAVLLWNPLEAKTHLTLRFGGHRREIPLAGLESKLVEEIG